jgi:hypothetical protein
MTALLAAMPRRTVTYVVPDKTDERLTSMSVSPISRAKMIR